MKNIIIFGLARSGIATINSLSKLDYQIQIGDDNSQSIDKVANLKNIKKCYDIKDIKWDGVDFIIISPGVPLYFPKPHDIVKLANQNNVKIICDVEYFYQLYKNHNYIGITGTNGKSTSTDLIANIFKNSGKKYDFGGNIGKAVFDMEIFPENSHYILELSSYQLDLIRNTHLKIAILLNITPDHLERHGNFKNYILSKKRIFQNQGQGDFSIIGIDNKESAKIYNQLEKDPQFKANLIPFSTKIILDKGFSIQNQIIYKNGNEIANLQDKILIKGAHNLENILASFISAYICQIDIDFIIKSISNFTGLKHRMQFVRKINNINFINDSKATSLESSIMAIKNFDNIYLILGGQIKDDDFNLLAKYKDKIIKCYLIGKDTDKLYNILLNKITCQKCYDLKKAISNSYQEAKKINQESNILLSPAAASFDQWQDFEERGEFFIKEVEIF
ncbi:UDP-N-acetylmuramoyl-L-alanine--D-glutamate ligase [Rickettsiales bacterium]|nr:UDP-N-acetylmuramoyl-L-alanine--D-glutamate ligase [Rickettsiales bacterium]MDB2550633.1 UDP-N-acetylmuramoyl-L-alanine--D-glutamate ligase [Rickettsiales bacterium]